MLGIADDTRFDVAVGREGLAGMLGIHKGKQVGDTEEMVVIHVSRVEIFILTGVDYGGSIQ